MEQQVKELMNDQLLDQAAITFGLRLSDLQVIGSIEDRNKQARRFLHHFLKGYERHTTIDSESLHHIGLFLRLRELIVYIGMHRSFDLTNLDDWTSTYIQESRARLEKGIPIVEELF